MKRLLIVLFIGAGIVSCYGYVFAESWEGWSNHNNWEEGKKEKSPSTLEKKSKKENLDSVDADGRDERFCSYELEVELLELLKELKDPSLSKKRPGGESEVRRKYRIARRLREFDDCRAEDALKALIKENACEDLGEGEIYCVKWGASTSLQEVKSKKDLKKLTPDSPLEEQLKVFKKYGPHPHDNEFASNAVMEFLIKHSDANPKVYVPLMVEYFTNSHEIMEVVLKYPEETNIGLKRCLFSSEPTVVWVGINLARTLGKVKLLGPVYKVSFEKVGPLDYSQHADIEEIQTAAIGFFRMFEKKALPYYRGVLNGDSVKGKEYVVSGIQDLTNSGLLALLKEFSASLENRRDEGSRLLAERVQKKIDRMEEVQK